MQRVQPAGEGGGKPEYYEHELSDLKLVKTWLPKEEVDADGYVQCEGGCDRWFHYLCCGYPALEQLGDEWGPEMERLAEQEKFYCLSCRLRDPAGWAPRRASAPALRADALPAALSDTIEEHLAAELQANHVTAEGLVARVVAAKWAEYKASRG